MKNRYHPYEFRYRSKKKQELERWTKEDLIEYINKLHRQIAKQQEEITSLRDGIDQLKRVNMETKQTCLTEKQYQQNWPYSTKIIFLLSLKNHPLTSKEIDENFRKLDQGYEYSHHPKGNLAVHLYRMAKSGRIKSVKFPGVKNLYYGLLEWFEKDGCINPKYAGQINGSLAGFK